MKILIIAFVLSMLGTTLATPVNPLEEYLLHSQDENKEVSSLLQSLVSMEQDNQERSLDNDGDDDDSDDADGLEDIATLQGVFTVLEQSNAVQAKAMDSDDVRAQFWKWASNDLWKVGKNYLKKKYCSSEEQEMRAMLQELLGEQGMTDNEDDDEDTGDGDSKAIAELQTVFKALKKADAKMMESDANIQGWWKKVKRWAGKKIKRATRRYLC